MAEDAGATAHLHLSGHTYMKGTSEVAIKANELPQQISFYTNTVSSFAQTMTVLTRVDDDTQHPSFLQLRNQTVGLALRYAADGGALHKGIDVVAGVKTFAKRYMAPYHEVSDQFKSSLGAMVKSANKYKLQLEEVAKLHYEVAKESQDLVAEADYICESIQDKVMAHDKKASFHEQKSMKYEDKADRAQDVRRKFRKAALAGLVLAPVLLPVGAAVAVGGVAGAAGSAIKKKFHEKQADEAEQCAAMAAHDRDAEKSGLEMIQRLCDSIHGFSEAMESISQCFNVLASSVSQVHKLLTEAEEEPDEDMLALHYNDIRSAAKEIDEQCNFLTGVATNSRKNLLELPAP